MKTGPQLEQIIRSVTKVIDLNDDELNLFTSVLDSKTFTKRDFILKAGEFCRHETFVAKGALKIFYSDDEGIEHIVKFAIEDWWAFDLQSFTTQTPAFYSIQAIEKSDTLQISKANQDVLYQKIPAFEKFSRIQFQNSYILLQQRMTQNLFSSAEEKYDHFKEKYPGLELRIPQKEIAAYLGITPEFLSMLRKKRATQPIS